MDKLLTYIQSPQVFQQRVADQLEKREVDTGQYFGQEAAFQWEECAKHGKIASFPDMDIGRRQVSVIDLGPGTGKPCVSLAKNWNISGTVVVDVSEYILHQAMELISNQSPVRGVVADFVRDNSAVMENIQEQPKIILCVGNTIANFRQQMILPLLHSMLSEHDKILIGVRLYQDEDSIRKLTEFFASETNCLFGTAFLAECGAKDRLENNRGQYANDPEEEGVRVIDVFHQFNEQETLAVGDSRILFQAGESIRFLRSRQYEQEAIPDLLRKYGLEVIQTSTADTQGFFLCKKQ
jgi:uncharacterized SAM-dependent methyltransferase